MRELDKNGAVLKIIVISALLCFMPKFHRNKQVHSPRLALNAIFPPSKAIGYRLHYSSIGLPHLKSAAYTGRVGVRLARGAGEQQPGRQVGGHQAREPRAPLGPEAPMGRTRSATSATSRSRRHAGRRSCSRPQPTYGMMDSYDNINI